MIPNRPNIHVSLLRNQWYYSRHTLFSHVCDASIDPHIAATTPIVPFQLSLEPLKVCAGICLQWCNCVAELERLPSFTCYLLSRDNTQQVHCAKLETSSLSALIGSCDG